MNSSTITSFSPTLMHPGENMHQVFLKNNFLDLLQQSKVYYIRLLDDKVTLDYAFFKQMSEWVMAPVNANDYTQFWKRAFLFEYLIYRYEEG